MNIYRKFCSTDHLSISLLGISIYQKKMSREETELFLFSKLFHTRRNRSCHKIYLLGVQIYHKKKQPEMRIDYWRIANMTQRIITTALLHQKTFGRFRACHKGENVVLVAAGPTVNFFSPIIEATYVGVNRAFKKKEIQFTYMFAIDSAGLLDYEKEFLEYDCIKFIGDQNLGMGFQIPEDYSSFPKTYRYKTNVNSLQNNFCLDIDSSPLVNAATVAIQAMQFILFTQPKRIFLVGTDCTVASKQHFTGKAFDIKIRGESAILCDEINIDFWKRLKKFASIYYPHTEIISINPVKLKGVFRDVYTRAYLDIHPEINNLKPELLEDVLHLIVK